MSNNKKKNIARRLQDFLSTYNGKVLLNYAYSWGAAVVILGALFKLTHLPGANAMLFIGMGSEVLVFFISGFDRPYKSYKWESIFPNLKISGVNYGKAATTETTTEGMSPATFMGGGDAAAVANAANAALVAASSVAAAGGVSFGAINGTNSGVQTSAEASSFSTGASMPASGAYPAGNAGAYPVMQPSNLQHVTSGNSVVGAIATETTNNSSEVTNATELYLNRLKEMTNTLERFSTATDSLTHVSDTLLDSYKSITDNSGSITAHSLGYVQQMETLNRNLNGLNTIYEIQLRSISSQIDTIDKVNTGLSRIKDMYEGSTQDSERFHEETEKMAKQIEELNAVYARMLQAMTVNVK